MKVMGCHFHETKVKNFDHSLSVLTVKHTLQQNSVYSVTVHS